MFSLGLDNLIVHCRKAAHIIVFGAGDFGKQFVRLLKEKKITPAAVFSNFPEKDGPDIDGIPVMRPCAVYDGEGTIYVIAIADAELCDRLNTQLLSLGIEQNQVLSMEEERYGYFASQTPEGKKEVISQLYAEHFEKPMDWDMPRTYSEILNWEKLYIPEDVLQMKTKLADKLKVREYVRDTIGEKYLSKVIGVWDRAEEIDFASLPERFVLKCNHGSGMNIVVRNREALDRETAVKRLNHWAGHNYTYLSGSYEKQYEGIPHKIFCEEYLDGLSEDCPQYNVFCFHGKAKWICRLRSPHTSSEKGRFYDSNWHTEEFYFGYPQDREIVPRPETLDEVLVVSEKLSRGLRHVRVDLYEMPDKRILFSELTFSSWAGLVPFVPERYDALFGSLILETEI